MQLSDNGAFFDCRVSNSFGSATSESAQLTVTQNTVPTASITKPVNGTTYAAGTTIAYAGTGNDVEDVSLLASRWTNSSNPMVPSAAALAANVRNESTTTTRGATSSRGRDGSRPGV